MKYVVGQDVVYRLVEHPRAGESSPEGVAPGTMVLEGQDLADDGTFEEKGNWFGLDQADYPAIVEILE